MCQMDLGFFKEKYIKIEEIKKVNKLSCRIIKKLIKLHKIKVFGNEIKKIKYSDYENYFFHYINYPRKNIYFIANSSFNQIMQTKMLNY